MRKTISAISFLGIVVVLVATCQRTVEYAELSSSVADNLRETNMPGVFISSINEFRVANQSKTATLLCPKACATKTVYWVQVTYPVTVCYPPDIIVNGVLTQGKAAPDSIASIIQSDGALRERITTRTIQGYNPLWCKTKYGPWIAEITDSERCDESCGEGTHDWRMEILGTQGALSWEWTGTMDGRPPQVTFIGQPWIRSSATIDCRPFDLTDCTGNGTGSGGQPAVARGVHK